VRNGERFLGRALDSLLAQEYPNVEIIVSDNASTDRTEEICRQYADQYEQVRYSRSSSNIGMIPNARKVLELARGDYFVWAGDDDEWSPQFSATLAVALDAQCDAVVAMCATARVTPVGDRIDVVRLPNVGPGQLAEVLSLLQFGQKNKYNFYFLGMFKTAILRRAFAYYPDIPGTERFLLAQLALVGSFVYVDDILFYKTLHPQGQTERRAEETYNQRKREKGIVYKKWWVVSAAIMMSPVVPVWRKVYAPVIFILLTGRSLWRRGPRRAVGRVWSLCRGIR
jgi:glycosyltransferase involved in cell wall biosynthesis